LNQSASDMSSIVETIQTITGQIHLLALNATIESARAGEAGKGFAVVASEVKNLAGQVKNASTTISTNIEGMQSVAGDVAHALRGIAQAMQDVQGSVSGVAAAIEEQSAVSNEISRNMQEATVAVSATDGSINAIASALESVSVSAEHVQRDMEALVR